MNLVNFINMVSSVDPHEPVMDDETLIAKINQFISSEQKDDTLTIKDKYIVYYYDTSSFTYTVYNTSEQTTPVATFTLQQEMTDEEVKNHILSTYEVYLKEYTHTFKKDNNDNWYWVSTEPSA